MPACRRSQFVPAGTSGAYAYIDLAWLCNASTAAASCLCICQSSNNKCIFKCERAADICARKVTVKTQTNRTAMKVNLQPTWKPHCYLKHARTAPYDKSRLLDVFTCQNGSSHCNDKDICRFSVKGPHEVKTLLATIVRMIETELYNDAHALQCRPSGSCALHAQLPCMYALVNRYMQYAYNSVHSI